MPVEFGAGNNATPATGTQVETTDEPGVGLRQVVAVAKGARTQGAVAPDTTADLLLAANPARIVAAFYNNGAVTVYLGDSGVTSADDWPLPPGGVFVDNTSTDAWYGRTASGTGDIRFIEVE